MWHEQACIQILPLFLSTFFNNLTSLGDKYEALSFDNDSVKYSSVTITDYK